MFSVKTYPSGGVRSGCAETLRGILQGQYPRQEVAKGTSGFLYSRAGLFPARGHGAEASNHMDMDHYGPAVRLCSSAPSSLLAASRGHAQLNATTVPTAFCLLQMCSFQEPHSLAAVEPEV